jgi:hypothetical protein
VPAAARAEAVRQADIAAAVLEPIHIELRRGLMSQEVV